ncbi:unnamed protein product [Trichogramma brassicae]|uniref:DUF4773 domain-containing protein n=1 Tax=Trichogramma brassicae TaxID=86971 RepID=A0A6H5HZX0_9HYME|nr:unnamed protein product [Trichogramma brassicae]
MTWKLALLAFCLLCGCVDYSTARLKAFDGSFYDVASGRPLQGKIANETSSSNSSSNELPSKLPFNLPRIEFNGSKCECQNYSCQCCAGLNQRACVNVTYDPDEFEFTARISMNDQLFFTRTVSGKNPRPVCVPVPRIPAIRACIRFYNIYFQGRNVHACVNMEGRVSDTTLFKVGMDCIRLGQNGVALVKPEDGGGIGQIELLPSDPGEADSDEDYDDDYDDYDDDDDDLLIEIPRNNSSSVSNKVEIEEKIHEVGERQTVQAVPEAAQVPQQPIATGHGHSEILDSQANHVRVTRSAHGSAVWTEMRATTRSPMCTRSARL